MFIVTGLVLFFEHSRLDNHHSEELTEGLGSGFVCACGEVACGMNPTSSTCGRSCCPRRPFHHISAKHSLTVDDKPTRCVLFPSQIKANPECSPSWWLLTATAHCSRCVFCNLATVRLPELNGGCFAGLLCQRHHDCARSRCRAARGPSA